jgi:HemY protein
MIRVLVFLIALALLAGGFAWLADRPGDLVLTWMGYRIQTSLMVAMVALIVALIVVLLLWTILTAVWRAPGSFGRFLRHRREMKAQQAISRGLIAVGAGDLKLARRAADEAARLQPNAPLALLLDAQSAQMAGDRAGAERAFRAMTRRDETRLLGLRGLFIEAQRRNDPAAARRFAEEAVKASPAALGWAGQAVLDERCAVGDWAGALDALEAMRKGLDKADYRRKRAVLLTARAQALQEIDRDAARDTALEAVKLAPDLVPAAALAGRRLAEAGDTRKARRILERAWEASPHPDIAEAYADVRLGDSARERLARMQKLADRAPGQREGALAVARAALAARDFTTARAALEPYLATPTQRVAALMAELESAEHGDTGRSREWMSRAVRASGDPVWTADGVVSDHWLPVSPSGRLDGFEWRVPLAEIGNTRPVIEVMPPEPERLPSAPEVLPSIPEPAEKMADPPADVPAPTAAPVAEPAAEPAVATAPAKTPLEKPAEPVIPLMHAPDDPGPGAALDGEPEPGALPAADGQRRHKIKDLFR